MEEIVKHINDTNASYRKIGAGDAKNTDLFLDNEHYAYFEGAGEKITVRFNKENLTQAILFIASVLPMKYDQSATHKVVPFSQEFVLTQLALLDALFAENGHKVDTITQVWDVRKDVPKKNGEIDARFYFKGLLKDVVYDYKGQQHRDKFTIRNYFAGGYSELHIKKADDSIFDIFISNVTTPYDDGKENDVKDSHDVPNPSPSLQQIFYGAPGTGKSYHVKEVMARAANVRTTFHPDSDYSTFVGAYKPTMKRVPIILQNGTKMEEEQIVYQFVPQAFLKAYVGAWRNLDEPFYLVIEEINRGNCAQVFGDLFQLLDREADGYSSYPIDADDDIRRYLGEVAFTDLTDEQREAIGREDIITGERLLLPPNLHIWATMNTSDQSLFPIDSAFKRRWDWTYMPIGNAGKGWKIACGENCYDWWQFLEAVNDKVGKTTDSEDKKLGYFFVQADANGKISAERFVGKVVFYLWNDVFRDYGFDDQVFAAADGGRLTFQKFFQADGTPDLGAVERFLTNLGLQSETETTDEEQAE